MRSLRQIGLFALVAALASCATAGPKKYGWGGQPSGGGISTVHTSSPVSGDGSSGTPVTIADGAVTNAKLATSYVVSGWLQARAKAVQAVDPTLTDCQQVNTRNVSSDLETATATNTGVAAMFASTSGMVIQVKSGTTANSLQILRLNGSGAATPSYLIPNLSGTHWAVFMQVNVRTTPDANTIMRVVELAGSATSAVLGVRGATSTSHWSLYTVSGASHGTDTTQTLDIGNTHNVAFTYNGTSACAMFDDVANATCLASLSDWDTNPAASRSLAQNGATAANQEFWIEKWGYCLPPGP